jgi:hypothetical protein
MKRLLLAVFLLPSLAHAASLNSCGFETCDVAQATLGGTQAATVQSVTVLGNVSSLKVNVISGGSGGCAALSTATIGTSAGANLNVAEAWFSFKLRVHILPSVGAEDFLMVQDTAAGDVLQMRILPNGTIRARYPGNTAGDDSASGVIAVDTTYDVGVHVKIGAATGQVQIQVGGVDKINSSSVNTGTTNIGKMLLGKATNANSECIEAYFDNFIVDDAAFNTYSVCGGSSGGLINQNRCSASGEEYSGGAQ